MEILRGLKGFRFWRTFCAFPQRILLIPTCNVFPTKKELEYEMGKMSILPSWTCPKHERILGLDRERESKSENFLLYK